MGLVWFEYGSLGDERSERRAIIAIKNNERSERRAIIAIIEVLAGFPISIYTEYCSSLGVLCSTLSIVLDYIR